MRYRSTIRPTMQGWRSTQMPEPIFFLSHFRIKEAQLDVVRQLASEVTARLYAEKPQTVLFLSYLDADGGKITFLHAFANVESMDLHFAGASERSQVAYQYMVPLGWEVYGNPSATALDALRRAADSAGVPLASHPEYLAGFLRLEPA
jgi:hypothetical protein